ncbi:putative sugar transporter [Mariannaea sp. PMI_226]|nr:putative sugar transporter [Mariannaea sp. PMI_226]
MANERSAWSMATPMLLFSCFCLLTGDMLFGYDTGSFGGILANPPLSENFLGCLFAGPAIERFGHRAVFVGLSAISCVGIIIELTAAGNAPGTGRVAQFIVGRIIVYISVGLVEVNVTTYQSEIVPAAFRGIVVVSLQLFLNAGSIVSSGVNKAFSTRADPSGWRSVAGIQFVFPVLISLCAFFIPNSPRWLLSKDREEDAVVALRRLRPEADAADGHCDAEIQAIKESLQDQVHKAPWLDLFRGTNLRRTLIVMAFYFFQQATGQAFVSTYQTVFYKENGYASHAFDYPIITSVLGFVAVIPAMYLVDTVGRRYSLIASYFFQAFWMYLLAGLGQKAHHSPTESGVIVASFMLFSVSFNIGGASIPYLLGTEIPNSAVREKTQSLGGAWNVIWAFATNYSIPYMIKALHFQVGWVFGSISVVTLILTFFFLPETKGRTLEEIDAIFEVPFNPFRAVEPPHHAIASSRTSQGEGGDESDMGKTDVEHGSRVEITHV